MSYTQRPTGPRLRGPGPNDDCQVCRRPFHEPLLATPGYNPEQHPTLSDAHIVMYHYGRGCSCGPHEGDHPPACDCYFCAHDRIEKAHSEQVDRIEKERRYLDEVLTPPPPVDEAMLRKQARAQRGGPPRRLFNDDEP